MCEIPNAIKHNPVLIVAVYLKMHSLWMFSSFLVHQLKEINDFKQKIYLGCMSIMHLLLLPYLITSASTLYWGLGNNFLNSLLNFHYTLIPYYKNSSGERYSVAWNDTTEHRNFTTNSGLFMQSCTKSFTLKNGSKIRSSQKIHCSDLSFRSFISINLQLPNYWNDASYITLYIFSFLKDSKY